MSKTVKTISKYLLGGVLGLSVMGNVLLASDLMLKEAKIEELEANIEELEAKVEKPVIIKATIDGVDYLIDQKGNHFKVNQNTKIKTVVTPDGETYLVDKKNNKYKISGSKIKTVEVLDATYYVDAKGNYYKVEK